MTADWLWLWHSSNETGERHLSLTPVPPPPPLDLGLGLGFWLLGFWAAVLSTVCAVRRVRAGVGYGWLVPAGCQHGPPKKTRC
jgi:hypothetical protein